MVNFKVEEEVTQWFWIRNLWRRKQVPCLYNRTKTRYERVEISKEFVSRKEKNTKMFSLKVVGDPVFRVFEYLIRFAFLGIINAKFYTKNFYLAPL